MGCQRYDIKIDQGSTFGFQAQFKDSSGNTIDQTGSTYEGKIRSYPSSPDVVATFTIAIDGTLNYAINVSLTATETAAIEAETSAEEPEKTTQYWYDIEKITGSVRQKILHGAAVVSPEVTY